jgi:tRNA-specific 2-thiouridylase
MAGDSSRRKKVFVAMSGGVDSSTAAALLCEAGHEVSGVTMCFELPVSPTVRRPNCCGLEAIDNARKICRALGIPHHVLNYGDALETLVIRDFISEYAQGRTPNPCVRCNQFLKFDRLLQDIHGLGGEALATGHYARIVHNDGLGRWELRKAVDARKDQSYFLYGLRRDILSQILFPLGELTKDEVRAMARERGLVVADQPDSQDICFVPEGRYQDFLAARGRGSDRPGLFADHTGKVVGQHGGVSWYTIGQREGLGIALGYPAYVYRINTETNTIYVGPQEKLFSVGLEASALNLVSMDFSKETFEAGLKIRYNHSDIKGTVAPVDEKRVVVRFAEPQRAVTPGQSVVFYDGDVLLGGAVIDQGIGE